MMGCFGGNDGGKCKRGHLADDVHFLLSTKSRISEYGEKAFLGLLSTSFVISRPHRFLGEDSRAVFHGDANAACSLAGINAIRW